MGEVPLQVSWLSFIVFPLLFRGYNSTFYMPDTNHFSDICIAHIFSHPVAYLFILLMVLFDEQLFLIVMKSLLSGFLLHLFLSLL